MISSVIAVFAGLVLLSSSLGSIPGFGGALARFARWLSVFDVVIGVVAIVIGILELLSLEGILLILAGVILAVSALSSLPPIGPAAAGPGQAPVPFRLLIGPVLFIFGLLGI